jgi:DNA-binding transcriptional LysR family regulator
MNLELLRTFVIFAKSKNILEAARTLRVSQPTVSIQLQRLEEAFHHPLFSQEGKKKVLTPFGRALLEESAPLLAQLEASVEKVEKRFSDPARLALRIGARAEILSRIVQRVQFPGSIQFMPLTTQEALDQLLSHRIDIAISHKRPDLAHIHSRKIFSDRAQWICHEKWLKGMSPQKAVASLAFLSTVPFLAYKKESPFLEEWLAHLGHQARFHEIKPHRICEDWNAIVRLVEEGQGYALIPSSVTSTDPSVKVQTLPAEAVPEMTFYALYHFDLMKIPAIEKALVFS